MRPIHHAFLLYAGQDTGGTGIRSVEAFRDEAERDPLGPSADWDVRLMTAADNYIHYTIDLKYDRRELERRYDAADVVHLSHTAIGHDWYDAGQGKPTVLMHHGIHEGMFALNLAQAIEQGIELGAVQTCSTANLELFGPKGTLTWTPSPYNLSKLAELRRKHFQPLEMRPNHAIRIGHAPTDRKIKSTDVFIEAILELKRRKHNIEAVLIEKQPNTVCLLLKSTVDIFVDQLKLGYGQNAIEAWGMGIPVVGGIESPVWRKFMQERWEGMPLYEATEANLADKLEDMVISERLRSEFTSRGLDHVRRWHSQAHHVAQMSELYANARPTKPSSNAMTRRLIFPHQPEPLVRDRRAERLARLAARGKL